MAYGVFILCIALLHVMGCYCQFPDPGCLEDRTLDEQCKSPHSSTNATCSGRGDCICGMCDCHQRASHSAQKYSGRYCQCDDYSCPFSRNQMCGGPGQGECECGECRCKEGWTGPSCECPLSNETCLAINGMVCNGVGECKCGICQCSSSSSYKGPTCEECPTCPGKCFDNRFCALCVWGEGPYSADECESKCPPVSVVDDIPTDDGWNSCKFIDAESDCNYYFSYKYQQRDINLKVQKTKECLWKDGSGGAAVQFSRSSAVTVLGLISCLALRWMTL